MLKKLYSFFILLLLISSCATFKPQYKYASTESSMPKSTIEHSFYFIGDAGNSPMGGSSKALVAFKKELSKASKNSTAIFLGDNIYEKGLPKKSHPDRAFAEHQLNIQTAAVKDFKGETIFIPGNHDWYSDDGVKGVKRQENYIEKILGKNTFLPENGCPIESIHVSEDIELILIDSKWFMANWDKHPTINDDCEIKTRELFFDEYKSLIKKARGKTTIVAVHHPMYTNGAHGGQYSFASHMKPLPVLGTVKNIVRKTSGVANVDLQNKRYNEFKKRLVTISQENKKVVFVSGHEHNLQYLVEDNLHQIVSGSGSKVSATRNIGGGQFSYGTQGFARLDVYENGSSYVRFYKAEDHKVVFETEVLQSNVHKSAITYSNTFSSEKTATIYSTEETDKSGFYKFLWGDRYRNLFSTEVVAPTVNLDTLFGGVTIVKKGGGNQSKSLRLEDEKGTQYVMRALRKNAVQYLQAVMFKDQYVEGQFDNTGTEDLILDVFTGSHPYAPFTIATLSDAVGVFHTNPVLYYIPKQKALGNYNDEFGDELYMIEEHTSKGHNDLASFGFQNKIISTDDVMKQLHKDEDIVIDEASYIRARLFDMLIGDWDRHQDQWRWIEFKENGKKVYRPLPRDRDQAFSIMSNGFMLSAVVALMPTARMLRKYSDDLVDVKGMNIEPYPIDMELIQESNRTVWNAQVKLIQEGITDSVIEEAFLHFPQEMSEEITNEIKHKLKARRANLQQISDRYYNLVNKFAIVKGSNKDDWFDIERLPNGATKITVYRIQGGEKGAVFHERIYTSNETKEIWLYALDDKDIFNIYGNDKKHQIKLRLIGGQNKDTYNIEEGKRVTFYDYKSKESTVVTNKGTQKFTDDYETNVYNYKKLKHNTNQLIPVLGYNPDDGFKLGISNTFTIHGFERNPFTQQHNISAGYYFATKGYDLDYKGEFAQIFKKINFGIDLHFNSPNYAISFFGYGNSTPNYEADENDGIDVNKNYNRVKIKTLKAMPSLIWRGKLGGQFKFGVFYESNDVDQTEGRFLDDIISNEDNNTPIDESVFDEQDFYGVDAAYHFENKDNEAFPTLGMLADLQVGYKNNVSTTKGFGYVIPEIGFSYKLVSSGQLVLATKFRAHINLGDGFEFYQGATIGANTGLRGYRKERFTGKNSFAQTTDIRWDFLSLKTRLVPISLGVFGGVDYGRVWVSDSLALDPAFNQNKMNTSFGGGFFVNMVDMMAAYISVFQSDDGMRFAFKLGFGF